MEKTVSEYISRHKMLRKEGGCLVALSGGADSVALLLVLKRLGYRVEAAHCNFRLRGEESDRDELFVRNLCSRQGVPLHLAHFDTRSYAATHRVSIEMAARDLRYSYFMRLLDDLGLDAVCVAHHREDSVETVLINLLRGTGLHGLCGIRPVNGRIVRPLLCLSRRDIEGYLASLGQDYVTDSTNLEADVVRNKLRLNVMPLLRDINPSADMSLSATSERISEAVKVYDRAIAGSVEAVAEVGNDGATVSVARLSEQVSPESVLYDILKRYGFQPQTIAQVYGNLSAPTGKMFQSGTHDLLFDRGNILIERHWEAPKPLLLPEEGLYRIGGRAALGDGKAVSHGERVSLNGEKISLRVETVSVGASFRPSRSPMTATLDMKDVKFPLTLRPCAAGDRFVPFGMTGFRLVSDYLTDRKKTLFEKRRQMVVADASGSILWLIGERTDNRFRVGETTTRVLRLTASGFGNKGVQS